MALGRRAGILGEPAPGAVAAEDTSRHSPALPARRRRRPARAWGCRDSGVGPRRAPPQLRPTPRNILPRICAGVLEAFPPSENVKALSYTRLFKNFTGFAGFED